MGVLQGTPDLPFLFKVALFGTEPVQSWAVSSMVSVRRWVFKMPLRAPLSETRQLSKPHWFRRRSMRQ